MINSEADLLKLIKQDGMNLRLANHILRDNKEIVLEAIKNNPHSIQFSSEKLKRDQELLSYVTKDNCYYWHSFTDDGYRYDIPLLMPTDPRYYFKYIYFMRIKERSPDTFKKIINWA